MSGTQWIANARLVLPDGVIERGALKIEDGCIADICHGNAPARALDVRGMTLLPGLVDMHGDMIEKELEPRPGTRFDHDLAVMELDKRLAASGVTTAFASLSFADGLLSWPDAVRPITQAPADAVGLKDRGRLQVGTRADLILVESSPRPRVRLTMVGGHAVYHDGRLTQQQAEVSA